MLGLIARCDKTGLGIQTRRIARILQPDKILLINSKSFNGNEQYPEWYEDFNVTEINGFPTDIQIEEFLDGLDKVISCETFYNNRFTIIAKNYRVKTILIANPEFFDWFNPQWAFIPLPNKVIVPSKWMLREMKQRFNATYLPTPIFRDEYFDVMKNNLKRQTRNFLFMNGKTAAKDRNGLESLYEALELAKGSFTVTVKAQNDIKKHPDPRLIYDFSNPDDQSDLYRGYDCLILPRRYGGQAMSMCEALYCGLPVIMTDVDPNNRVLPPEWLVLATKTDELKTRILLDVLSADAQSLANKLDTIDLSVEAKLKAVQLGNEYDADLLKSKYAKL